jgi:hypothetical protein
MSDSEPLVRKRKRRSRSRTDLLLVFDPTQKVPDAVLDAIIEEWLIPCLVEKFLRDRDITQWRPHSQAYQSQLRDEDLGEHQPKLPGVHRSGPTI